MDNFDFIGLLRILREKGYELRLYPGERDEFHILLTHLDWDTWRRLDAKCIINLNFIKSCDVSPNVALSNIIESLLAKLDLMIEEGSPDDEET